MLSQNEIKYLNALKVKKYRYKYQEFIVEGPKIISDLLDSGFIPVLLLLQDNFNDVRLSSLSVTKFVPESELKKISCLQTPYFAFAVFKMPGRNPFLAHDEWTLALDEIQDPGNLGTIIRTADWLGIQKIVLGKGCVDAYAPKVVQSTMGSIARVDISEVDLVEIFSKSSMPVYGGVFNGKDVKEVDFQRKGFILIGNEGHGISANIQPFITHPVTIPRIGKAESLNAAISMAIICSKAILGIP